MGLANFIAGAAGEGARLYANKYIEDARREAEENKMRLLATIQRDSEIDREKRTRAQLTADATAVETEALKLDEGNSRAALRELYKDTRPDIADDEMLPEELAAMPPSRAQKAKNRVDTAQRLGAPGLAQSFAATEREERNDEKEAARDRRAIDAELRREAADRYKFDTALGAQRIAGEKAENAARFAGTKAALDTITALIKAQAMKEMPGKPDSEEMKELRQKAAYYLKILESNGSAPPAPKAAKGELDPSKYLISPPSTPKAAPTASKAAPSSEAAPSKPIQAGLASIPERDEMAAKFEQEFDEIADRKRKTYSPQVLEWIEQKRKADQKADDDKKRKFLEREQAAAKEEALARLKSQGMR